MFEYGSENVPDELQDTFRMLKCAFPNGVEEEDFLPLLFVLNENMSFRQEAIVVGKLIGRDYTDLLNNIYLVASESYNPDFIATQKVKQKLMPCGYENWVKE